jgi:hypothetical protein
MVYFVCKSLNSLHVALKKKKETTSTIINVVWA